jgi:hypothetical protein
LSQGGREGVIRPRGCGEARDVTSPKNRRLEGTRATLSAVAAGMLALIGIYRH